MKQLLIFVFALAGLGGLNAQSTNALASFNDTISTSSSLDTLNHPMIKEHNAPFVWEVSVQADSLSGGTNATAYIQHKFKGSSRWTTVESITIDGVQTISKKIGDVLGGMMRVYVLAPSSTQSTRVQIDLQTVRSVPTRK